ncbi:O-antigen ligase family protein [Winogradskyella sp.]|uniref:O-antigen ligase family protein n=1 Tax=Winogradskyella sp. TaxID=1883156 RepID=UPI003AB13C87
MKKDKLLIKVLLLLYLLYFSQGIVYGQSSIISQLALLCILIICCVSLVKSFLLVRKHNYFYKIWTSFLFLNILGFILTSSFSNVINFGMFKGVLVTSLSFYPFYYVSLKMIQIKQYLTVFLFLMLPLSIAHYYTNQISIFADRITDNTNVVNNAAYLFVSLIPFLFFIKRKIISYILLAIISFFIIGAAKRGALIAGILGVLVYLYYLLKEQSIENKLKRIRIYLVLLIGLIIVGYFAYNQFLENEFLKNRLEEMVEGNTSNRTENYTLIWEGWLSAESFVHLIFGFGFAASREMTGGLFAHNDWMEALSNFGLLGFTLYLFLFINLIKNIKKNTCTLEERMQLIAITLIWFFMTLVSMFYTSLNSFLMVMLLGYLIGRDKIRNDSKK